MKVGHLCFDLRSIRVRRVGERNWWPSPYNLDPQTHFLGLLIHNVSDHACQSPSPPPLGLLGRTPQHIKSTLKKDSGNAFAKHLQIEHPDLRAGRVCPGMFSLWEPDISWVITSSSSLGQISLPLLLSRIFLKTPEISFRFLTANKVRELQRRAPPVSIELSKT